MIKMKERGQRKMFSCQKHFSKVNPVQNDNNNNKIVVKKSKRASSSASDLSENENAAYCSDDEKVMQH